MKWIAEGAIAFNIAAAVGNALVGSYLYAAISAACASACCFMLYHSIRLEAETARIEREIEREARIARFISNAQRLEDRR